MLPSLFLTMYQTMYRTGERERVWVTLFIRPCRLTNLYPFLMKEKDKKLLSIHSFISSPGSPPIDLNSIPFFSTQDLYSSCEAIRQWWPPSCCRCLHSAMYGWTSPRDPIVKHVIVKGFADLWWRCCSDRFERSGGPSIRRYGRWVYTLKRFRPQLLTIFMGRHDVVGCPFCPIVQLGVVRPLLGWVRFLLVAEQTNISVLVPAFLVPSYLSDSLESHWPSICFCDSRESRA